MMKLGTEKDRNGIQTPSCCVRVNHRVQNLKGKRRIEMNNALPDAKHLAYPHRPVQPLDDHM